MHQSFFFINKKKIIPTITLKKYYFLHCATNPNEDFKMRKMTLQFCARNAQFSDNDQLQTDDNICLK